MEKAVSVVCAAAVFVLLFEAPAAAKPKRRGSSISAKSAVIVDARSGRVLFGKNSNLRLPPASTTKLMTVLVAMERVPLSQKVPVSAHAAGVTPSRAGLTAGASYMVRDLILASLVSSSNDAAVALAEAAAGSEAAFARLMNEKALRLGMRNTRFVNATGLTEKNKRQFTTAYDLSLLMRAAARHRIIDDMLGIRSASIRGSDGKTVILRSHNKMLWKMPESVKGKTGWTFASRHTFVGTDFSPRKTIHFAMLSSSDPWKDIERLATLGQKLRGKRPV